MVKSCCAIGCTNRQGCKPKLTFSNNRKDQQSSKYLRNSSMLKGRGLKLWKSDLTFRLSKTLSSTRCTSRISYLEETRI
uniref:THAP-type domain-containing protein n=1 Tax=Hippocampus comes TaxID=109280 RepID=A0A3Q2YQT9_HIPCM